MTIKESTGKICALLFFLILIPLTGFSQEPSSTEPTHVIRLQDGTIMQGKIMQNDNPVVFSDQNGQVHFFERQEIDKIVKVKNGNYRLPPIETFDDDYVEEELEIIMQYGQKIGGKGSSSYGVHAAYGWRLSESFLIGIGAGADYNFKNDMIYLPVFLRLKAYLNKGITRPFIAMNIGYAIDWENTIDDYGYIDFYNREENLGGFMMTPSVGVSVRVSRSVALDISAGYRMQWIPAYSLKWDADDKRVMSGAIALGFAVNILF